MTAPNVSVSLTTEERNSLTSLLAFIRKQMEFFPGLSIAVNRHVKVDNPAGLLDSVLGKLRDAE